MAGAVLVLRGVVAHLQRPRPGLADVPVRSAVRRDDPREPSPLRVIAFQIGFVIAVAGVYLVLLRPFGYAVPVGVASIGLGSVFGGIHMQKYGFPRG